MIRQLVHSHIFNLVLFSVLVSIAFSFLMREGKKDRIKFALILSLSMIIASILIGWLIFPFPS